MINSIKDKIKILFVIHDLSVGGAEKVLVNLVNNMDSSKFDITVMALFDGGVNKQFLLPHIKYVSCFKKAIPGNSHFMKLLSPRVLHKWLIKEKYDIEVAYLEGPSARIVSGCTNKDTKTVSWIHCTYHSKKELAASYRNYNEVIRCYQNFSAVAFVSEEVKKAFQKICKTNAKAEVIYNTNESEKIKSLAKETDYEINFKQDIFYWCGVGKIVPNKGFDRMLRIQKRLLDEGYNTHLLALGTGHQLKELQQWCVSNHIDDKVSFLGYQTNPYKYLYKCDLFVCASFSEGFSTAATEALLLGVPVLTTDVSGMREMLGKNNEFGIITDNDEESLYKKLKELVVNPVLLEYYKQQSKVRGENFSTEHTVNEAQNFLKSVLIKERKE